MDKAKFLYSEHFLEDIGAKMLTFDGLADFKRLLGPGVYMLSNQHETLYVGMAKNILSRIADDSHSAVRMALKEADRIAIILSAGEAHARGLETELIHKYQPKYNVKGKMTPKSAEFWRKWNEREQKIANDPFFMMFRDNFAIALHKQLDQRLG